jgi:hypothetical protein
MGDPVSVLGSSGSSPASKKRSENVPAMFLHPLPTVCRADVHAADVEQGAVAVEREVELPGLGAVIVILLPHALPVREVEGLLGGVRAEEGAVGLQGEEALRTAAFLDQVGAGTRFREACGINDGRAIFATKLSPLKVRSGPPVTGKLVSTEPVGR